MRRAIVFIVLTVLCAIGELLGLYELRGILGCVSLFFYIPVLILGSISAALGAMYILKPCFLKVVDFYMKLID